MFGTHKKLGNNNFAYIWKRLGKDFRTKNTHQQGLWALKCYKRTYKHA